MDARTILFGRYLPFANGCSRLGRTERKLACRCAHPETGTEDSYRFGLTGRSGPNPLQRQGLNHAIEKAGRFRVLNELVDIRKPPTVSFGYGHRGVDVGKTIAQNARTRQRSG